MRCFPECVVLWQAVSAGQVHTCGIAAEGQKMYCWGLSESGQLDYGQLDVPAGVSAWLVSE